MTTTLQIENMVKFNLVVMALVVAVALLALIQPGVVDAKRLFGPPPRGMNMSRGGSDGPQGGDFPPDPASNMTGMPPPPPFNFTGGPPEERGPPPFNFTGGPPGPFPPNNGTRPGGSSDRKKHGSRKRSG